MTQVTLWFVLGATVATGLLAGASLDQSIKQLPARHRIGIEAYSAYSRAADLGNGLLLYAVLGVSSGLLPIAAAITTHLSPFPVLVRIPVDLGACCAVLHSLVTAKAAPVNFSQRRVQGNLAALTQVFNRFAHWQIARAVLQVVTFVVLLWSLIEVVRAV
jgi:hypothetical protein